MSHFCDVENPAGTAAAKTTPSPMIVASPRDPRDSAIAIETVSPERTSDGDRLPGDRIRWLGPVLGVSMIVIVLAAWQLCAVYGYVDEAFSSKPTDVVRRLYLYVTEETFFSDAWATAKAYSVGLAISMTIGVVIGSAMGSSVWIRHALDYLVTIGYSTPRVALIPTIVLWFGVGYKSEIVLVVLMSIFPIILNTSVGIRNVDDEYRDLGKALCMSRLKMFFHILVPGAVPSIATGMRLAFGMGIIGVVVAEFLAATQGLGYRMQEAAGRLQPDKVFAVLAVITAFGVAITGVLKAVEKRAQQWRLRS
jgi:taurine transport system permease protein